MELAGTEFPGNADISNPNGGSRQDRNVSGSMQVNVPSLRDGWFRSADSWSSSKAPPGAVSGNGVYDNMQVRGSGPGLALLYQIYNKAGKPTGYWIGAKFYSASLGSNHGECSVYDGNPMTTAGHETPNSNFVCEWKGINQRSVQLRIYQPHTDAVRGVSLRGAWRYGRDPASEVLLGRQLRHRIFRSARVHPDRIGEVAHANAAL